MTHIQRIEFTIKTGCDPKANAGTDSKVYCSIAGREFRLEKSGEEFKQGASDTFIAGLGTPTTNIENASLNDPNNPQLFLRSLPVTGQPAGSTAGTKPEPIYIRYDPKDQNKGWQLENATVKVVNVGNASSDFPPTNLFQFDVVGGNNTNRWLGNDFGTSVALEWTP
jgi:hypothetical protein